MRIHTVKAPGLSRLDRLLLRSNGLVRAVDSKELEEIPSEELSIWCSVHAIYQIVTTELVDWLANFIGGRSAIEICSGNAGIGRELHIPCTDSCLQQIAEVKVLFHAMGQTTVCPPLYVEKQDANAAVLQLNPEVVVGAFVTQRWLTNADTLASIYGPLEEEWVDSGKTYVHIGNDKVHGTKRILDKPHRKYRFPWLYSRVQDKAKNAIWVWN